MRVSEQCEQCQTKEAPFQLSSHPTLCLNCYPKQDSIQTHIDGISITFNYPTLERSREMTDPIYLSKSNDDGESVGFSLTVDEIEWLSAKLMEYKNLLGLKKEEHDEENSD